MSAAEVIDSLSEAADLAAAAARARLEPEETGTPASRKAFIAGAGCALVLFVIALAVMRFGPGHRTRPVSPAAQPAVQPHFSKVITDQVAAVEADFVQDDLAQAQIDVRKLQTLAPDHPRLQFFLTLLDRGHARNAPAARMASAVTSASRPRKAPARSARNVSESSPSSETVSASVATAGAAIPAPIAPSSPSALSDSPAAEVPQAVAAIPEADTTGSRVSTGTTFAGRTIEESTTPPAQSASHSPGNPSGSAAVKRVAATPPAVTAEAQLTRRVSPEYPDSAIRKGIEGYVDVHFTITPQGTVTNVSVVDANPADVFNRAATDAVRRWRYDPKVIDGQPVGSQSQVHLQFKLGGRPSH